MTNTLNRAKGDTITTADWQTAVESVEFPAYSYDYISTRTYGGVLDINRYAKIGYELQSIASYRTKFLDNKDIRSNYYQNTITLPPTDYWIDYADSGSITQLNNYSGSNQTARLTTPKGKDYDVTTSANGIYLIYAELVIPSIGSTTNAMLRLLFDGNVVAYFSQSGTLITPQGFYLQGQYLSAYKGGTYTLEFYLTGNTQTVIIRLGYTELIGNSSGCGG